MDTKDKQYHDGFLWFLEEHLHISDADSKAILDKTEKEMPIYIRDHFNQNYKSLYEELDFDYRGTVMQIFGDIELNAQDLQYPANLRFSNLMTVFAQFLRTKYNPDYVPPKGRGGKGARAKEPASQDELEGAKYKVTMTMHERKPEYRKACIAYYGYICQICGMDFEKAYGEIGKEFIEVHHIDPVANYDEAHKIDPQKDLIPLCSNCHSMIHRGPDGVMKPDELRQYFKGIKYEIKNRK